VRLFVLARHGESELNHERRVNGDPAVPVALTALGRFEAEQLGVELANVPIQIGVHTRFGRTRETAELVLLEREIPLQVEPLLDDIDIGDLEGAVLELYRDWKRRLGRKEPFPGGESLDAAALRFAAGFRRLLTSPHQTTLVVCHEIPIRYALNAAAGSDLLDGPAHEIPNATPYLFEEGALRRAVDRIEQLAR
jgi:broad specificity phosphatase PhoE